MAQVLLLIFPALMAYAAASDLLTMRIPNAVSILLMTAFVIVAIPAGLEWREIGWHVLAGGLTLLVTFGMFAFGWIGGGDAKLASSVALWLGFNHILTDYLVLAAIAGGALGLATLYWRRFPLPRFALSWEWLHRLHNKKEGIPYGVTLAGAALVTYPGSPLWNGILQLQ
jgi:prepilin peptidase CpaA